MHPARHSEMNHPRQITCHIGDDEFPSPAEMRDRLVDEPLLDIFGPPVSPSHTIASEFDARDRGPLQGWFQRPPRGLYFWQFRHIGSLGPAGSEPKSLRLPPLWTLGAASNDIQTRPPTPNHR